MTVKFNYIKGNLLDTEDYFILHGCNAQGVMGSGVAKAIRDKWPEVFKKYSEAIIAAKTITPIDPYGLLGGDVCFVNVDNGNRCIVNMITQKFYGKDGKRYINYEWIYKAFDKFELYANNQTSVSMPFIGCGLGGGSWNIIKAIIEDVFKNEDITFNVYYLNDNEYKNIVGE